MRISTQQFYRTSTINMSKLQFEVQEQSKYISSGKQVLTAKDAPVNNSTLAGLKEELRSIARFDKNIIQAENHNNRQETSLSNVQDIIIQIQAAVIQANNGGNSPENLTSIANQIRSNFDQLLDVANTKNETGEYIFSGYKIDQRPFSSSPDNSVGYAGDNGASALQIATNLRVPINTSGDEVFMAVDNIVGDFIPTYIDNPTPPINDDPDVKDIYVDRAVIVDRQAYNASGMAPNFTFDFTDADLDGIVEVTVTDGSLGVVHGPVNYTEYQPIAFNGMEVNIDGKPLPGDQFNLAPQEKESIFETVKNAIDWIENSAKGVTDVKQHQVDYNHMISQLDAGYAHITNKRAEVGLNLQSIDVQKDVSLDVSVMLQSARGKIEDLDYAQAVSAFEQKKLSLQAAQQTFSQIEGLSLFNYI
jgi:flagellar hook-associated protein 3 FlgL